MGKCLAPAFTDLNTSDDVSTNPKMLGDVLLTNPGVRHISDFSGNIVSDLGVPSVLSIIPRWRGRSALAPHVSNIVCVGSLKKMIWVDAFGVVTFMKNKIIALNRAVSFFKRKAVGKLLVLIAKVANAHQSVTHVVNAGSPLPTSIGGGFVNFGPKSFIQHHDVSMGNYHAPVKGVYYW